MPDFVLLSDSLPDLLPSYRAPGIHISEVIQDLAIRQGFYQRTDVCSRCGLPSAAHSRRSRHRFVSIDMTRAQLGLAVEHALCERMILDSPGRYRRIPEMEVDGLYGNLDLWDDWLWGPHEMKSTWQSSKWGIESSKHFWSRHTQHLCYAMMMEKLTGRKVSAGGLHMVYMNGNYRPMKPEYALWGVEWEEKEKVQNWDMIRRHADRMRKEKEER